MMRDPRRVFRVFLVILLMLAAAPHAAAQVQPFVSAGLAIPAGALAEPAPALDYGDAGLGMQLEGGIALGFQSGAVDVRLFGTYARMGRDFDALNSEFADAGVDVQAEGSAQVIGGGLGIVYYFPAQLTGGVYPYVVANGGLYRQRLSQEWSGADLAPGTEDEIVTDTRLGAGGGLGLIWDAGRLRVFLESRLQALMSSGERPGYAIPLQLGLKLGPR